MILEYLASEGGFAILDVNPGLIFWTTVTFGMVMFGLRFFAWKPISQALDARAEKIHSDLDRAESIRKEAEEKLNEYVARLDGLRAEGQDIIAEGRKDAEQLKNEILETARRESGEIRDRSLKELEHAKNKALDELYKQVVEISVAVAGQIIGKSLKAEDHKKLIEDSISKLRSMN